MEDGTKAWLVNYISDEGERSVMCHGAVQREGDGVWIGDCYFRNRDLKSLAPAEDATPQ